MLEIIKKYPEEDFKTSWIEDYVRLAKRIKEKHVFIREYLYMLKNSRIFTHYIMDRMEKDGWLDMKEYLHYKYEHVFIIDQNGTILESWPMKLNLDHEQEFVDFLRELCDNKAQWSRSV